MKLYLAVHTTYLEDEGIENTVEIFKTREEAVENIEQGYEESRRNYDQDDIEWDNFEKDSYSFCAWNSYGCQNRYEGTIIEKEVN